MLKAAAAAPLRRAKAAFCALPIARGAMILEDLRFPGAS